MWELAQIESNKKYNTKLTPLPVDPCKLYCMPVIIARLVCSLLSFCAREFPTKSETTEPGEIIVEYAVLGYNSVLALNSDAYFL